MSQPKVTLIIPVYNCEKYLSRCLGSVLRQTETDFEVILVDDGSTDDSGRICDDYSAHDHRIRVIHQENAGVSAARNAGLDAACGEFVGFIDADDYIAEDMLQSALTAIKDCDMIMFDAVTVWPDGKTEPDTIPMLEDSCVIGKEDWYPELLRYMAGSVCRCIYRHELISHIICRFSNGIKFSEDRIFNIYMMGASASVVYLKQAFYFRYMQPESAVHRFHEDYFEAFQKAHYETQKAISHAWNENESYRKVYYSQFISGAIGAINNYFYGTSTLSVRQRIAKIKSVCENEELQRCLSEQDVLGFREKLLQRENVFGLAVCGWLWNLKNRR